MKNVVFGFGIFAMLFLASCQTTPESKLIGTWKVVEVETDFDEARVTPQTIKQVVETQNQTFFKILNDSVMVIISLGNTFEAKWQLNPDDQKITYVFDDSDKLAKPFDLGVYKDKQIVAESEMSMGKMVVHFEKE
ncbi:MAG: hypothetical protein L3J31_05255 [Bacteroidales bacterium]|nr:hypothetical protein [Bacteroidales bacterium]MCF6342195.1 hypothetical protein [Bacteroidales bacterium]